MSLKNGIQFTQRFNSFNATPIIDIVFLLIIFFLVVFQFIEAENFPVTVPDDCEFAVSEDEPGSQIITLTVIKAGEKTDFAVGPEKIAASNYSDIVKKLTSAINSRLGSLPPDRRIVTLRIDRNIRFAHAQYALAAVAESIATDIQIAALKDKMP